MTTARHLARRLLQSLCALWAVATGTFVAVHLAPGTPLGQAGARLPPGERARLVALYGLDRPLPRQYLAYMGHLLRGRLGWSLADPGRSVVEVIRAGFPVSAALGAEALAWSLTLGTALGLTAALRRGGVADRLSLAAALAGLAVPSFVLAVAADSVLGVRLRLLPVAGWGSPAQSVLPALALGALPFALVARLVRAEATAVLASEHVRLARAKGLGWGAVVGRHVLRNAALPVLSVLGPLAAAVLTGSFVVESVFAIPGLGGALVGAVADRDYPLVMGVTLFYAALVLGFNWVTDVLRAAADPRATPEGEAG